MPIVICIGPAAGRRLRAASGIAGTNMCIAWVPVRVTGTSSHKAGAGGEGEAESGGLIPGG
ncbi:MAG: hypothetical protein JWP65_240 [Ramlibacter sp.]|jgi:hypothetical protein|uniref:hypothetical protein n=1 Tax=Ramlibacter sp. TaxID=1917967 RepID=UPI002616394B|nr:hypothetical protein [Ramlibacter sp.]MDB5749819.1 hypothetical protein [Ramlibacter sp.]